MSPVNADALERCAWTMPADSSISPGSRCVEDASHEKGHVVAASTRSAVTFWRIVNEAERSARVEVHADLRDGSVLSDEECRAMWVYTSLASEDPS